MKDLTKPKTTTNHQSQQFSYANDSNSKNNDSEMNNWWFRDQQTFDCFDKKKMFVFLNTSIRFANKSAACNSKPVIKFENSERFLVCTENNYETKETS